MEKATGKDGYAAVSSSRVKVIYRPVAVFNDASKGYSLDMIEAALAVAHDDPQKFTQFHENAFKNFDSVTGQSRNDINNTLLSYGSQKASESFKSRKYLSEAQIMAYNNAQSAQSDQKNVTFPLVSLNNTPVELKKDKDGRIQSWLNASVIS